MWQKVAKFKGAEYFRKALYFLIPFFYFYICVYCCVLLDITALLELGIQAFRYTHNNIC